MSFKKFVLTTLLLTSISAYAGWSGGQNTFNQAARAPIVVHVNRIFFGHSQIDLLADPAVRNQIQGLQLKDITIIANSVSNNGENGRGTFILNGFSYDGDRMITPRIEPMTFRIDPLANVYGQTLRSLEFQTAGDIFIQQIIYNFADAGPVHPLPPYGTGEVVEELSLNEHVRGYRELDLISRLNLGHDRKRQAVRSISVVAHKHRGSAEAYLVVNNQKVGLSQFFADGEKNRLIFYPHPGIRLHEEIQNLSILVNGDLTVDEIAVDLEPFRGENRFESVLNQRVYDQRGLLLTDLINNVPPRLHNRLVTSVVLILNNSDQNIGLKLCRAAQSATPPSDCTGEVRTGQGKQIITLTGPYLTMVRETSLFITGMIDVHSVVINLY